MSQSTAGILDRLQPSLLMTCQLFARTFYAAPFVLLVKMNPSSPVKRQTTKHLLLVLMAYNKFTMNNALLA